MKKVLSTLFGASSVAAATLTLAAATMTSAEAGSFTKRVIDFDSGITHPAGTMIQGDEWSQWGVEVNALRNGNQKNLTIFDSNCAGSACSGGDDDLGTAYLGAQNRGNVLIIQENDTDNDGDGLYDSPDDDRNGGTISFDFRAALQGLDRGFTIDNLEFIDYDLGEANDNLYLTAYDKDNNTRQFDIADFGTRLYNPNANGDNSIWSFDFDQSAAGALEDVWKLDVNYNGISGAISKIEFEQYIEDQKPKAYVPEPSAIVGLAFLGGGMFLSRRRKSS